MDLHPHGTHHKPLTHTDDLREPGVGAALFNLLHYPAQAAVRPFHFLENNMTLAAQCLLEIQTVFPTADARVHRNAAEIFVPRHNSDVAPLILGSGPDFDVAGVRAVANLGDTDPAFAKRSAIYGEWAM